MIGISNIAREEESDYEGRSEYSIALVLTVKANSYPEALLLAENVAEGVGQDGENIYAVHEYDEDNEGQRVLYLPRPTYGDLTVVVDWDVTDEEATEAQEAAALKSLPDQVTIPADVVDEWIEDAITYERRDYGDDHVVNVEDAINECVADWLSDEYGWCVNGWARV